MAGYHSAGITTETRTATGEPVEFRIDYQRKQVHVTIGGRYHGAYKSRSAAKDDLRKMEIELVDVVVKGGKR